MALPKSTNQHPTDFDFSHGILEFKVEYDSLRAELKAAHRSTRNLKTLSAISHAKNDYLREQNAQLRNRREEEISNKNEKARFTDHIEMLERHIAHLQHDRQKREGHILFLTEQVREANEVRITLESERKGLQRQMREISSNLTECRDDLLRLQPMNQEAGNEIAEEWNSLDLEITSWVDDWTEDAEEEMEVRFEKLKGAEDLPDFLRGVVKSEDLWIARRYPSTRPLFLRYLIHQCLNSFVFNEELYLFGLDPRSAALLKGIEEGMKLLEPRRDVTTLRRWRSETLQSLLKLEAFIEQQERHARLFCSIIQTALFDLIPRCTGEAGDWDTFLRMILLPSIRLTNKIRFATTEYNFTSQILHRDPRESSTVSIHEIKDANMIDLSTHKIIKHDSIIKVGEDGRIGEELLVVTPASLRMHSSGKGKVLICKPTVLIKLDEPMVGRSRGIKTLGSWTQSWFAGEEAVG